MSRRRRARAIVLQVLYQDDLNPTQPAEIKNRFINARLNEDPKLIAFANELIQGVTLYRQQIDEKLAAIAANWRLGRMAATDRNVLRLGAYEILFGDTPDRVAINEAIELARRYGTDQSSQFVNGVLDRLMKRENDGDTNVPPATGSDTPES
jgi:N utilization substance protein B